ncbi:MAG: glycosyltransferase [Bryobacteraceae bacterium]
MLVCSPEPSADHPARFRGAGPTHIAFLSSALGGGGAERVICTLASALSFEGYTVDVVLMKAEGVYVAELPGSVRIIDLGSVRASRSLAGVVRYLQRNKPAVLISAVVHANLTALAAQALAGVPTRTILTVHSLSSLLTEYRRGLKSSLLWRLERGMYRFASRIVAVSDAVRDDLEQNCGVRAGLITVIHNPINITAIRELAEEPIKDSWFGETQTPLVVAMGRLAPEKAFDRLILAFAVVRRRRDVRLAIAGEGPLRSRLDALVDELGLRESVHFTGFVANPYPVLAGAAVSVMASRSEGFGNVVVESLALGVPVIASEGSGGPVEILENGRFGTIVPREGVSSLAAAIERHLDTRSDASDLMKKADQFSTAVAVERYMEVVDSVINRRCKQ